MAEMEIGALPETVDAVRRRVADAELAAEHAEQIKLASLYTPPADRDRPAEKRLRAAIGNLGVYAVCLGVVPDPKDRAAVVALMRATFPMLVRGRGHARGRRLAPAFHLAGVEVEQVEHAADRVVNHVVERLGLVVESRHRRGDDRAHFGERRHVAQVNGVQRRFARQQNELAAFFQHDVGGSCQQVVT